MIPLARAFCHGLYLLGPSVFLGRECFRSMMMTRAAKIVAFLVLLVVAGMLAPPADAWPRLPVTSPLVEVDWQGPESLPPRFRNHCVADAVRGRSYCSDHCGRDYQFYYCARGSFGCCRVGFGYCDWSGLLRCAP
jgi:hypothetical protein